MSARPLLVDRHGKPMRAYLNFHDAAKTYRNGDVFSIFPSYADTDTDKLVTSSDYSQMRSTGRFIFANVPMLRGALLEQASLSFPLTAQYVGEDKAWGNKAEEWLWQWRKIANVKGNAYDAWSSSRIRLIARKVDGDIATVFFRTANGYPKIQLIRAHRIKTARADRDGKLESGPYAGYRINHGVILDSYGTPMAYLIPGATEEDDVYVPARACALSYRPELADQDRGIPEIAGSITSFEDLKRLREYEMRAQQIMSSFALVEKNETGTADMASAAISSPSTTPSGPTASGLITETFEQGMVRYFRSGTGAGLEAFRGDRPSADAQAFEDKIVTAAFYGIEWDPHFALAIKEPGGAWARTIIQKVRRCILINQYLEAKVQLREDTFGIANAIKLGLLPEPKDGRIIDWKYQAPAGITADSGNEENAKREAYKLGLTTLLEITGERGQYWEEVREQRSKEVNDLLARATKVQSAYPSLSLQEAIALIEQRSPNPPIAPASTTSEAITTE